MAPVIQIAAALVSAFGFCLVFDLGRKHLIAASALGGCCWAVYLLLLDRGMFTASLTAALVTSAAAQVLSRVMKAPAVLYYMPGIVPLVPGGDLFYMMKALVTGDRQTAGARAAALCLTMLGIAAGVSAVSGFADIYVRLGNMKKGGAA